MKVVAFFNNKGGVGKTSLVYHLAWMYADLGRRVVAADLDPQANLTALFFDEEKLEGLWPDDAAGRTVLGALKPLVDGTGALGEPTVHAFGDVGLVAGDLNLSTFEDELGGAWPGCGDGKARAFRIVAAFSDVLRRAAALHGAELVLVDVGPSLGALNRSALLAADHVVVPLAPDLFSLKGLRNLGARLATWRREWADRLGKRPLDVEAPEGAMRPLGYVVMQHAVRLDRPVQSYRKWMDRIPEVYRRAVLEERVVADPVAVERDPHALATLRHYRSLMPMAHEARKPVFQLTPADGALGGQAKAVAECRRDFERLAREIARRIDVAI